MVSKAFLALTAYAACGAAAAQNAAPLKYESALSGYQPYKNEKPANWRDVNDTMAVLGGHNAHMRDVEKNVTATGTVLEIDRAGGRVRIDGDALKALGWPAGIAYWQLKTPGVADQVKAGERVSFKLEKDGDVYRIAGFDRNAPPAPVMQPPVNPHAGHRMGGTK